MVLLMEDCASSKNCVATCLWEWGRWGGVAAVAVVTVAREGGQSQGCGGGGGGGGEGVSKPIQELRLQPCVHLVKVFSDRTIGNIR